MVKFIKYSLLFFFLFTGFTVYSQTEKYPIYNQCKSKTIGELPKCFSKETKLIFYKYFKAPKILKKKDRFKGQINTVF